MGQRLGITVQGVGWWPFWGLDNPLGVHSDIFEGFHSEITRTLHLDQNHRPRFSSAEANRASDKPGCNLDSTCSTNLKKEGQKQPEKFKISPVGDAWTAAFCQLKSIFQLFNCIGVTTPTSAVLASQLLKYAIKNFMFAI